MNSSVSLSFPPFQLDLENEQLFRQVGQTSNVLHLRPKTFAVLRHLVERASQLVTKDQLLATIWPDTYVTDSALKSCIRELRQTLQDDAQQPRYIETVHRRGYRFIANVERQPPALSVAEGLKTGSVEEATVHSLETNRLNSDAQSVAPYFVGREGELAQLYQALEDALEGEPQIVFLTGEAGIGKTSLVEVFLEHVRALYPLWTGHGQCIEQYGSGEAYMPVLEALSRLGQEERAHATLVPLLQQYAPTWLRQMPALHVVGKDDGRQSHGATHERMLREMTEALEAITQAQPLILVLEDLHWSDQSTLELLATLGRRRGRARLFLLGTYRSVEVAGDHPLRGVVNELQLHTRGQEIPLGLLSTSAIQSYIAKRFPKNQFPPQLEDFLLQRTEGNPLFLVNVVDDLLRRNVITNAKGRWQLLRQLDSDLPEMPQNIRQAIERQIDQLDDMERVLLETASAAGVTFSSPTIAAGLDLSVVDVEAACDRLVRRGQFIQSKGTYTWPDGTLSPVYGFIHALYQETLYERIPFSKRQSVHQQIGMQLEQAYGEHASDNAAELAVHFECGRDFSRAVHYHQLAGDKALERRAHPEAAAHFTQAIELAHNLRDSIEHTQLTLALETSLAVSLGVTYGYGAPQVESAYSRAWELCQKIGQTTRHFPVLAGLTIVYQMRGKLQQARELGKTLFTLADQSSRSAPALWAHLLQGMTLYSMGILKESQSQQERALALYDSSKHGPTASGGRDDPGVICLSTLASILWFLGYPDQALQKIHETLALAEQLGDPLGKALALGQAAVLHQRRREAQLAREYADALFTLAQEHGFPPRSATALIYRGWAMAEQGAHSDGLAELQAGLEAIEKTGAELARPYYLGLLAEAYGRAQQYREGTRTIEQALVIARKNNDRCYEAELWRIKGDLALQQRSKKRGRSEGHDYFQQAMTVARKQDARSLELRAALSLARLWQQDNQKKRARTLLSDVYSGFTEGFETPDLREAARLLAQLP